MSSNPYEIRSLMMLARTRCFLFATIIGAGFALTSAEGQSSMTNEEVIGMVQAKLAPVIIKNAISGAQSVAFDLSVQGLIKLKNVGVDDQIVEAMQARASNGQLKPHVQGQGNTPTANMLPLPSGVGVFYIQNGKYEQIAPEVGKGRMDAKRLLAGGILKFKNENKVPGAAAAAKVSENQPRLLLHMPNRDVSKLNLLSMMEVRADERVLFVVEGRVSGNIKQKIVPVSLSEPAPGYVEMVPKQPLSTGEYAIVDYGAKDEPPTAWSFAVTR